MPADPVSVAVALADKIDTLVGLLGDRREADRLEGSVCAAPRRARRDPHRSRQQSAACAVGLPGEGDRAGRTQDCRGRCAGRQAVAARRQAPAGAGDRRRSARLLRRPPEGPAARAGRAPRSRRRRVRARRPGRSPADRPPRRGARQIPRHRGRQESARRHQARRQHHPHRGEEGRPRLCRRARSATLPPGRGMGAGARHRRRQGGGRSRRRARGFRRRHDARWRSCARMSMRSSTR